jgi:hypothetical protein
MFKTSVKFLITGLALTLITSCTNSPEGKVKAALDKELGKDKITSEIKTGVNKFMGAKETKFKESLFEYINTNTTITYSDIKINENKATTQITVVRPNEEDMAGILLMVSMMDQKKLAAMTFNEFFAELAKASRKTASVDDIRKDKFQFTIDLENTGEWAISNNKQFQQGLSKKNKVK